MTDKCSLFPESSLACHINKKRWSEKKEKKRGGNHSNYPQSSLFSQNWSTKEQSELHTPPSQFSPSRKRHAAKEEEEKEMKREEEEKKRER